MCYWEKGTIANHRYIVENRGELNPNLTFSPNQLFFVLIDSGLVFIGRSGFVWWGIIVAKRNLKNRENKIIFLIITNKYIWFITDTALINCSKKIDFSTNIIEIKIIANIIGLKFT